LVGEATEQCQAHSLTAAGIVATTFSITGVAADSGLFAYEPRTEARVSLTAMGHLSSGWAANVHRSIDHLGVADRTRAAIEKARACAQPRELLPGRYTVILEPAAVAGLIGPFVWALDAKSYYKGTSPFLKKLGRPVFDPRLTLRNLPDHPDLLGNGFNSEGLPAAEMTWVEQGVLKHLRYDRYTAQEHHVYPSPSLDAPYLAADENGDAPVRPLEDLIRQTDRGILVSNFWYIRSVNPTDLTLTGMTRDGTFLIEEGNVTTRLVDFRWHDSPLRALAHVEAFTAPSDAVSNEGWKMKLPALKLRDFNFSSVSRL
jgi:predicted Zn-dependent protease